MPTSPPVLLTVGQFYGTLAAARCLGKASVPVTLAEGHLLVPTRWSRFVTRRVACPDVLDSEAFLAWLLAFGAASPGHVLLPSSDDLAWLIAENRVALGAHFRLVPTPLDAVAAVLDKRALLGHCAAVGLDTPETWFPRSAEEAMAVGREVGGPLLIKPRTQVLFACHSKGTLVESAGDLGARFQAFVDQNTYGARIRRHDPDLVLPMLQRYHPAAGGHIYGLSGYVDEAGSVVAVRASRKILQRPRKLGIGLCFEEASVDPSLVERIGALCRRVGYRGMFEVELIEIGERRLLIDWNPRLYSQLAFDIDRGMELPRFAYADALGDRDGLAALAADARASIAPSGRVYCHRFLFEVMLRGQRLTGHLGADEERRWRRWWEAHRGEATEAVSDRGDRLPWGVDVIAHVAGFARHPRSFVRTMLLDR